MKKYGLIGHPISHSFSKKYFSEKFEKENISKKLIYRLEKQVVSIDGITDKIKISHIIQNLSIMESRQLRKYINEVEPGIDFKVSAGIPGGGSVDTFLRFNTSFFWPEL